MRELRLSALSLALACLLYSAGAVAQDIGDIEIPGLRMPRCFGFTDISEPRALAVCDALNLDQNVKARELAEQWLREQPDNPAAQFALSEVLFEIEGNMPRALFHLNRAEELTGYASMEAAIQSGNVQWHYLTLSQLSYVHQLMGNQQASLEYLDKINRIYGQDVESFRGWPLIKLKQYDAARASANQVLERSDNERDRSRAWNTLCAAELASLAPIESMGACERAIAEDEEVAGSTDTVYLTNASEVALSLLQMDRAEQYIDRATRYLNPASVSDPWIYKLYLTMNQSRFDEARHALDSMLVWREQQEPIVTVMNRAEHFLVSAGFLMLAGYTEDAVKLSGTALNQPDRNGSYSADDAQKDSYAALINMMANRAAYQQALESLATRGWFESLPDRVRAQRLRLNAWQAERRAAALFAEFEVLQNRLRPYAPLDVHIPEWVEPEIVAMVGTGVMTEVLEQAHSNGAFQLNEGYYYSYHTEIAAVDGRPEQVLAAGERALALLPQQEALLRARLTARMAGAAWRLGERDAARSFYRQALAQDPSITRRLAMAIPVRMVHDDTPVARQAVDYLGRSPRFQQHAEGLVLEVSTRDNLAVCLNTANGTAIACYTLADSEIQDGQSPAQSLVNQFQDDTFGLGFEISKARRSMLLGSSVILRAQENAADRRNTDAFLNR